MTAHEKAVARMKETARHAVVYAVKTGTLMKPANCESCGVADRLHGHHDDYLRPLEVRWLCTPCHLRVHGKTPVSPEMEGPLAKLRREAGFTQYALAKRIGIRPSHLAKIETGKITPGVHVAIRLGTVLNIQGTAALMELFPVEA